MEATKPELLSESELAEIEARLHLTTDGDAVFVLGYVRALIQTVRAAWKSFEISEAARGHDNDCYRELLRTKEVENTALREQLADTERERNAYRGQLVSLNSQLAQAEKERSTSTSD